MNENKRSVLYAGALQFNFPGGIGRFYLGDWGIGILQFLTSFILVGLIWSWIDGYLMITRQMKVKKSKVSLIYHDLQSNKLASEENQVIQNKSPIIAFVLQITWFGLGRIYIGQWIVGIAQLFVSLIFWPFLIIIRSFFQPISLFIDGWIILDSYCIFKGLMSSRKRPLNYSVAINSLGANMALMAPKDRFIAGMLQGLCPGLGRCYLGYWWVGVLQFLTSFMIIGTIWSWVDGHHILLDPDVDKDGKGNLLTDQYRLDLENRLVL